MYVCIYIALYMYIYINIFVKFFDVVTIICRQLFVILTKDILIGEKDYLVLALQFSNCNSQILFLIESRVCVRQAELKLGYIVGQWEKLRYF